MATIRMGVDTTIIDNRRNGLVVISGGLKPPVPPKPRTYKPRTVYPPGEAPPTIPKPVHLTSFEMLAYYREERNPMKKRTINEFAIWLFGENVWNDLVKHYER